MKIIVPEGQGVRVNGLVAGVNNHYVPHLQKGDQVILPCVMCGCSLRVEGDQSFQFDERGQPVPHEAGSVFAQSCSRRLDRPDLSFGLDWSGDVPRWWVN